MLLDPVLSLTASYREQAGYAAPPAQQQQYNAPSYPPPQDDYQMQNMNGGGRGDMAGFFAEVCGPTVLDFLYQVTGGVCLEGKIALVSYVDTDSDWSCVMLSSA